MEHRMRVTLARPSAADTPAISVAMMDQRFSDWLNSFPFPHDRNDGPAFEADPSAVGEYTIKIDGRFAGLVIAAPEFGVWTGRQYRRQGVALRAATLALSRYFASGAEICYARSLRSNKAMRTILGRLGFTSEASGEGEGVALGGLAGIGPLRGRGTGRAQLLLHRLTAGDFAEHQPFRVDTARCTIERAATPQEGQGAREGAGAGFAPLLTFKAAELARGKAAHFPGGEAGILLRISRDGQAIGLIEIGPGREPALALCLAPTMRGRGLAAEVLPAVCAELTARYALGSIWADVALDNRAARRLLEGAGFVAERPVMVPAPRIDCGAGAAASGDGAPQAGMRYRIKAG